jgi:hypothetical protein
VKFGDIALEDVDLTVIAVEAGISRPKARKVLETAWQIELDRRMNPSWRPRCEKPRCRTVDNCAVYDFPKSRIIRKPPPRQPTLFDGAA